MARHRQKSLKVVTNILSILARRRRKIWDFAIQKQGGMNPPVWRFFKTGGEFFKTGGNSPHSPLLAQHWTPSMSLTNGIRRHALNASRAWGSTSSEANFLARSATASQSSAGLLLSCLVQGDLKKRAPKVDSSRSYIFRNNSLSFVHNIIQTLLFPFPSQENISTYHFHTTWYLPHVPLFEPYIFQKKCISSTMIFIFLTVFLLFKRDRDCLQVRKIDQWIHWNGSRNSKILMWLSVAT